MTLDWVWVAILSPTFKATWCTFVVLYALFWAIRLAHKVRRIRRDIGLSVVDLEKYKTPREFAEGFETYDQRVKGRKLLRNAWRQLAKSLVMPKAEDPNVKYIRCTRDPSDFINQTTLVTPNIAVRFYVSVPAHLTAFGILGSFLGLSAGIAQASGGLSQNEPEKILMAIPGLLHGASLAFVTSVFGLATSVFFLMLERHVFHRLEEALATWVERIEFRLITVTPEDLALKQLDETGKQTKQLKMFNTELAFSLGQALEKHVVVRISEEMNKLAGDARWWQAQEGCVLARAPREREMALHREHELLAMFNQASRSLRPADREERESFLAAFSGRG